MFQLPNFLRMGFLRLSVSRRMVMAFAAVIVVGALLLGSSPANGAGSAPNFLDSLFTATSAVCVTGLAVYDPGSTHSFFGELILLGLIQVGGLGILSLSTFAIIAAKRRSGFGDRMLLEETTGLLPGVKPKELLKQLFGYTFMIEFLGACVLAGRFSLDYPIHEAAWLGLFHSVSAFCNAGFSLWPDSLMRYQNDLIVNLTIMALIMLGGLGFIVYADLTHCIRERGSTPRPRLSLHSRVVLAVTASMVFGGTVLIYTVESSIRETGEPFYQRLLHAAFLSVSSRTAGYNTVDTAALTNVSLLCVMLLMFVGGSPGSTGGGVKTTTVAILNALVLSRARNRPTVEIGNRSIPQSDVAKAIANVAAFIAMILVAIVALEITEGGSSSLEARAQFMPRLFEVISAVCTVGLSTGITPSISDGGKVVLIVCMFIGRLGPLIIALSLIGTVERVRYSYPEESVIVG